MNDVPYKDLSKHRINSFNAILGSVAGVLKKLNATEPQVLLSEINSIYAFTDTSYGESRAFHGIACIYTTSTCSGSAQLFVLRTRKTADRVALILDKLLKAKNV